MVFHKDTSFYLNTSALARSPSSGIKTTITEVKSYPLAHSLPFPQVDPPSLHGMTTMKSSCLSSGSLSPRGARSDSHSPASASVSTAPTPATLRVPLWRLPSPSSLSTSILPLGENILLRQFLRRWTTQTLTPNESGLSCLFGIMSLGVTVDCHSTVS
jgi:hypothetical protein